MRTLHIITGLSTGGAERALHNVLSGGLACIGDSVVLSLSDEGVFGARIRELGVGVQTLNMSSSVPSYRHIAALRRYVRAFRPELVQGWMYHGNLAALLASKLARDNVALAWNVRQCLYDLAQEKFLTRQVIRANRLGSSHVEAIVYNSRLSRRQHEAFGFAGQTGIVIPNGFDGRHLQPDARVRAEIRQSLGISADTRVIGHVARFHPMKDHAGFLHAAVKVLNRRTDVCFLLVGRDVSLQNPALAGIVPVDKQPYFRCVGESEHVADFMRAMDILCSSSNSEAFPNVLAEAMCLEVPCVVTDVGDCRGIVDSTGIIVPARDREALAQGLLAMLSKSTEEKRLLGRAARKRIESLYALPTIVNRYIELYEGLIDAKA